jgi:hypothetical protein
MAMILSLQRLLQAATAVAAGRSDAELRADVDDLEKEAMSRFREWTRSSNGEEEKRKTHAALDEASERLNQSIEELYGRITKSMIADLNVRYRDAPIGEVEAAYWNAYYSIDNGMGFPQNPSGDELRRIQELNRAKADELLRLIQLKKTPA